MKKDTIIQLNRISKEFRLDNNGQYYTLRDLISESPKILFNNFKRKKRVGKFWALKDVSFSLKKGETLGVIGPNGAGKSTLLKILARIIPPTKGNAIIKGKVASMLEVGTGFHSELSGRENIFLNGAILGMKKSEIIRKFDEIVDFSGVEKFLDMPVKKYSSGMQLRLAFSVAAHLEPEILLIDEVFAVGDMAFQRKSLTKMHSIVKEEGRTLIFVSHNMNAVDALCNKSLLLENGRAVMYGKTRDVVSKYIKDFSLETLSLQKNKIRSGDGKIRIINFWIEDGQGKRIAKPNSGGSCSFVFSYVCSNGKKQKDVDFGFAVTTITEQALFLNYLSYSNQTLESCPVDGKLVFKFKKFPLAGGKYKLSVRALVGGEEADYIPTASFFDVDEGDFYNTGILIGQKHSPIYVEGDWEIMK